MTAETKRITLDWRAGLTFAGGEPGGPVTIIDGDNAAAPGPMLQLLLAAASCTGSDVVMILEKMRVRLRRLRIEASGVRREQDPRRYVALHFHFTIAGEGLDQAKGRRAVELSLEKYCSVIHSLAPDISVGSELELL
ncbi:MAG: OsmC family protein [Gemmatimonadales bacterium]